MNLDVSPLIRIDLGVNPRVSASNLDSSPRSGSVPSELKSGHAAPRSRTETMMKRSLLCFGFLMILGGSSLAQMDRTAPAFYVVLNSLTKSCTVADKLPRTDTPNITVASDTIYKSRAEAETAIKTLKPCNP
jgi:hypothetical protein